MFFHCDNLTSPSLTSGVLPWEFKLAAPVPDQVRRVKEDRQAWYVTASTKHNFYTGIEPLNPNLRIEKENNPPNAIHAFVADYDIPCPDARIDEAVEAMKIKPSWIERSLGGNFRLVWLLERPLQVGGNDFCYYLLNAAKKWLKLGLLPGLDEPSFVTGTRLYCNGAEWRSTGASPVPLAASQSFFVETAKHFRFKAPDAAQVPLDVVEAEIRKKYPSFTWPASFSLNSQGPSFWIPESTSPLSAVVKPTGMFTYSAHAEKPFYHWGDILGVDFIKDYANNAITKATADVFFDGHDWWRPDFESDAFVRMDATALGSRLKVTCGLSAKSGDNGRSQLDEAKEHIYVHNQVVGAVPFVCRRPGVIKFQGQRYLNTYNRKPIMPAAGKFPWGSAPFLNMVIDKLFDDQHTGGVSQKNRWMAWAQTIYQAAVDWTPHPGQYCILSGVQGCGKTLLSRHVLGELVGGYVDVVRFLLHNDPFTAQYMACPYWCIDDDTPASGRRSTVNAMFKKIVANQQFNCNEKFQKQATTEWMGRLCITTNLDYLSLRIIGSLDNSSLDKLLLLKCVDAPAVDFPARSEIIKQLLWELPILGRQLLDWVPQSEDEIPKHSRFKWASYQNPFLLERNHQGSSAAPLTEILIETLTQWFLDNPDAPEYAGTVTQLLKLMIGVVGNDELLRGYKPDQINRYLEQIQNDGVLECSVLDGRYKTRIWVFNRFDDLAAAAPAPSGINFSQTS